MAVKIYPFSIDPEKYPEFSKRPFPVVTRKALGNKVQFTSLRTFLHEGDSSILPADGGQHPPLKEGERLAHLEETIHMYVNHFKMGRVLWPVYPTLFAANFKDIVDICVREGLYLFDFWGYVPGAKPTDTSIWGEYAIPEEADHYMREQLGDHFLGYDNGEQDGRYVVNYARLQLPNRGDRKTEYARFQQYFQKLTGDMNNHTTTLSSLTFLPYFAKEGNTVILGAETAQALPGNNMWFSFIRGAAKQYGLLYFGNASIFNRWGSKDYSNLEKEPKFVWGYGEIGRFAGTSISLLKRLIFNQWMYDCDILGFENGWFTMRLAKEGDENDEHQYILGNRVHEFTPIGELHQHTAAFVEKHGRAGVMHTPVAMLLDFHAGWVPPRHLYGADIYKVWGSLPYEEGDFQTHCLMSMFYPHYEDSGFYRNEQGFETATPYGEIMDVLLSDAAPEILSRYSVVLLTNGVTLNREVLANLRRFVEQGGTLIAFAGHVDKAGAGDLFGAKRLTCQVDGVYTAEPAENADLSPCLLTCKLGRGETRLILHMNGMEETGEVLNSVNEPNGPICQPYRLTQDTQRILAETWQSVQLLRVNNPALQYVTSVRSAKEYTFMVSSSAAQEEHFDILSDVGEITAVEELQTTDGSEALEEFRPLIHEEPGTPCHAGGQYAIHPGCVRLFRIRINAAQVMPLPETHPAARTSRRYLALPSSVRTMKRAMLDLPTFSRHFDGFIVPASYLENLDTEEAAKEAAWMNRQQTHILVDFTELINHYPNLSLVGNIPERNEDGMRQIERMLDKAAYYRCDGVLFCTQRSAETGYRADKLAEGFCHSIERIEQMCKEHGLKLMLRNRCQFVCPLPTTVFDASSALVDGVTELPENTELVLFSSSHTDCFGQPYAMNRPLASSDDETLATWRREIGEKNLPVALTADYASWDEVYADLEWLDME